MRKKNVFLLCAIFLLYFTSCVYAGETSSHIVTFSSAFSKAIGNVGENLSGAGKQIFFFLLVFELLGTWLKLLFEGKLEAQSFVMSSCKAIIILIVCFFFIDHAWSILEDVSGFITSALSNKPAGLNDLIQNAFNMANTPMTVVEDFAEPRIGAMHPIEDLKYAGALVMIAIGDFIILIAMIFAYIVALVTQAKLAIVMSFAILAMGFSGSQFTRDIAINGMRSTLAVSVELLVIYTLMGVSQSTFDAFKTCTPASWSDCYHFTWECIVAAIVLSALFQQLPGVVSGMFGQGGGGGGSALVGASMAISALSMAKSAGSMAQSAGKIAGSTVSGAGKVAGKVGSTLAGGVSAVKQHMPSAPPSISGSKSGLQKAQESFGRFSQGVKGAGKEAVSNRVSSMKEAFSRSVNNSADKILGRKNNNGVGKG